MMLSPCIDELMGKGIRASPLTINELEEESEVRRTS